MTAAASASDSPDSLDPEVTIEPADNGYIVRHYQRGQGKDSSGRTIRRVASTADEALEHAGRVLGGSGGSGGSGGKTSRTSKKRSTSPGAPATGAASPTAPSSSVPAPRHSRDRARRRRPRIGGRR